MDGRVRRRRLLVRQHRRQHETHRQQHQPVHDEERVVRPHREQRPDRRADHEPALLAAREMATIVRRLPRSTASAVSAPSETPAAAAR